MLIRLGQIGRVGTTRSLLGAGVVGNGPPFTITPYDFTGKDSLLATDAYSNSYESTANTARYPSDGYIDIAVECSLLSLADGPLFSRWTGANTGAGNSSYIFLLTSGKLRIASFPATGSVFNDASSSVNLSTAMPAKTRGWVRVVANYSTSPLNGFAAGTVTFFTSPAGATPAWTQLGTVVSGLSQTGFSTANTTVVAAVGTLNDANTTYGRFYRAVVKRGSGTILFNPDFTTKTVGQTGTFDDTGATPATWVINGPITTDMPPRATTYPRLKAGQTWKLKTLEISPDAALSNANGDWGKLWSNYPNAQFAERIQWAKDQGANAVKWTCSGSRVSYNNYPPIATLETYIADVCSILRAKGMYLYLSLAHSDEMVAPDGTGRASRIADITATAALWMKYGADVILGADICNEVQFGFAPSTAGLAQNGRPTTWGNSSTTIAPNAAFNADMAYFHKEMRTVMPDVPFSFSAYMGQRTHLDSIGFLQSQATHGMQFHDYHPYNGTNGQTAGAPALATGSSSQVPTVSDLTALEGKSFFIGAHLIGECGIQRRFSAADKQSWVDGLVAQATSTKSFGWAGAFIDYDFTSSNEPGDYGIRQDATLTARFAAMANSVVTA